VKTFTKNSLMVFVPETLADGCSKMSKILDKLQPTLKIDVSSVPAFAFFSRKFPDQPSKVKASLDGAYKASGCCQLCKAKLGGTTSLILRFEVDWDDLVRKPSSLLAVCSKCERISSFAQMMELYVKESLLEVCDGSELSNLVEHYLKTNGYKVSEIAVFTQVLSLNASFRKSMEALSMDEVVPEGSVDAVVASLVSVNDS